MDLDGWGLRPEHVDALTRLGDATLVPARVLRRERTRAVTVSSAGEESARLVRGAADVAVGDWVALSPAREASPAAVVAILPRRGVIARKASGATHATQTLAANVDVALVLAPLDAGANARKIERFLALARDGGVEPIVVLAKSDLARDLEGARRDVESVAAGARVVAASAATGEGIEAVRAAVPRGATAVLLGPSGAGKSTLANALLGEKRLATADVREDDRKGRHTTTWREIVPIPGGGLLVDTPGIREVGLAGDAGGLAATFSDIEALARACRFRDCAHDGEPGCAVLAALESGELDRGRYESHERLRREAAFAARKASERREEAERRLGRAGSKMIREAKAFKRSRQRE